MSINKKITPLSKFPTEALVMNYRRHRVCRTILPWSSYRTYNKITCKYDIWVPVVGKLETDKGIFDCIISYKKVNDQELRDHFTEIKGDIWEVSNNGWFSFTKEME